MPTLYRAATDWSSFLACHRLAMALTPPHRLRALLEHMRHSPQEALALSKQDLTRSASIGLTDKQADRLLEARDASVTLALEHSAKNLDVWVITFADPAYPSLLRVLDDAPALLFGRGTLAVEGSPALAIVGSRRSTQYGNGQSERFARTFAQHGVAVVSGGAAGIDTAAHRGALAAQGATVAVLGCGVDIAYPSQNLALFDEIVASGKGALLSEFPLESRPEPWRFPTRNRIIAGMTRATLLIESPADSGAMITARCAAEYNRDVWAVPGSILEGRSRGCHRLIQDGAGLADVPEDVLNALDIQPIGEMDLPSERPSKAVSRTTSRVRQRSTPTNPEPTLTSTEKLPDTAAVPEGLSPNEALILPHFGPEPRHMDEAGALTGLPASEIAVALTLLEMKGYVRRHPGNLYVRSR